MFKLLAILFITKLHVQTNILTNIFKASEKHFSSSLRVFLIFPNIYWRGPFFLFAEVFLFDGKPRNFSYFLNGVEINISEVFVSSASKFQKPMTSILSQDFLLYMKFL